MKLFISYLRRPFQDTEWLKKIGLGGLVGFIPLLNLSLLGYLLEWIIGVRRESETSEPAPLPEWNGWGKLLANGLMSFLIIFVYCILPVILLLIGNGIMKLRGLSAVVGALFVFVGIFLLGIASFILPAALVQFAETEKIESAYNISVIGERIANVFPEYLTAYLYSLGLIIVTWIILAILSRVIMGYIIIPVSNFYIGLVIFYGFSKLMSKTGS